MVELNSTLWIQLVNFLLLIAILHFLLYRPILNIIDKREQKLNELSGDVESLEATIEDKMAAYEEKLHQARLEAAKQREQIKEEGAERGKLIIGEAREEIAVLMRDFKARLEEEQTAARAVLQKDASVIAGEISEKVLGRSIQ